jgi:hypothetical protein
MEVRHRLDEPSLWTGEEGSSEVTNADEVSRILRQAAEVVKAADIPNELRPTAFGKAVDLLAGRPVTETKVPKQGGTPEPESAETLDKIAAKLGLDREAIDEIFEVEDGDVKLTIAPAKLEAQKTKGAKQVALLVAAARQAAGVEDWTTQDTIRVVAIDYNKFDSPNFAQTLSELGDYFSFSGAGRGRRLKMRRAGFEEAAALIERLRGTS